MKLLILFSSNPSHHVPPAEGVGVVSSSLYASLVPLVRCLSARYAPEGLASLTPFHRGTRCREKRGKEGVGDARSEGDEGNEGKKIHIFNDILSVT